MIYVNGKGRANLPLPKKHGKMNFNSVASGVLVTDFGELVIIRMVLYRTFFSFGFA